ncbi:MAG: alpha/beta hydrolase [Kofleriaceae bacterium]
MSLFDSPAFNERLFFPRGDVTPPPEGADDDFVEVGGASLHVRYHGVSPERRTLLLFHGNGEVVADYDDAAGLFAAAGFGLAVVDYRGYGQSTGTPTLRTAIADAHVILGAVHAVAAQPIVVMGRSLGSACAADLYAKNLPIVEGVVIESGLADLAGLVRRRGMEPPAQFSDEDRAAFDPLGKLARGTGPLLVIHGERDTMIAPSEAEAAFAAAGTKQKKLVIVPNRGHNDVSGSRTYWDALAAFGASLPRA